MKNQHRSKGGKLSLASFCYGSDQFKWFTARTKVVCLQDHTPLLSFLFIKALKNSDIYPGCEGREETKSIQVTVYSLLEKSECLRQILELVDTHLPHNILWLVTSKGNLTRQLCFYWVVCRNAFVATFKWRCVHMCTDLSQMLCDQRNTRHWEENK